MLLYRLFLLLLFLARLKVTRKQMKSYRVWPIKLAGFLPNRARFSLELPSREMEMEIVFRSLSNSLNTLNGSFSVCLRIWDIMKTYISNKTENCTTNLENSTNKNARTVKN